MKRLVLPTTATAPFCPSEVSGSVSIDPGRKPWRAFLKFLGPGLLVSIGYMDPGNWATDIQAGSFFGYALLSIVLFSSAAAVLFQWFSVKLGIVSRRDLAQMCRDQYSPAVNFTYWLAAEVAIIATDVAEVLGGALAFHLLIGCSLPTGVLLTALDTLIVLGFQGKGFRGIEAFVLGFVVTIALSFFYELLLSAPNWHLVLRGFLPQTEVFSNSSQLVLAVGILGATVMPHNLFLHSSIIQTRQVKGNDSIRLSLRWALIDTLGSLTFAFFINAAILILAASAFHDQGHKMISEIEQAYHWLEPILGKSASFFFALALLASGQSSTFTGTIAGQVILEGFWNLKIPCWQRRVWTRGLALVPAFLGVTWIHISVTQMLVWSQVVIAFCLPFGLFPLLQMTGKRSVMREHQNSSVLKVAGWTLFAVIATSNLYLLTQM